MTITTPTAAQAAFLASHAEHSSGWSCYAVSWRRRSVMTSFWAPSDEAAISHMERGYLAEELAKVVSIARIGA